MPWSQFHSWVEYSQVDPFGSERGDMQAALVASVADNVSRTLVNINRDPSKGSPVKPAKVTDFLLDFTKGGSDGRQTKPSSASRDSGFRGRRILSVEGWQRTMGQIKGIAEVNSGTLTPTPE